MKPCKKRVGERIPAITEAKDVRGAFDGTTDRSVWVRLLGWLLAPFRAAAETQKMADIMALWQHDPVVPPALVDRLPKVGVEEKR